jgi:hypothetical protein
MVMCGSDTRQENQTNFLSRQPMILPNDSDLQPVITGRVWDIISRSEQAQADEMVRCRVEPWYWLVNYVYTKRKDENVEDTTIERFPPDEYLRHIFHNCFTQKFLAIDKSRQMRMTWVMMAFYLWHCLYREHEEIIVQTKKEKVANDELIGRCHFMWKSLPSWLRTGDCKDTYCKLVFAGTDSLVAGLPSGRDQIRAYNPSKYFGDECGFWEGEFDDSFAAALACCKDIKLVSSANAGSWEKFICDRKVA